MHRQAQAYFGEEKSGIGPETAA